MWLMRACPHVVHIDIAAGRAMPELCGGPAKSLRSFANRALVRRDEDARRQALMLPQPFIVTETVTKNDRGLRPPDRRCTQQG
jgi:hypothetical protein